MATISLKYLFGLVAALVLLGFVIDHFKPKELFGATYGSQIVFGGVQIILGLMILAIVFVVVRKLTSQV